MPKRRFWPVALIVMGLIILATNLKMLPVTFNNFWPLILVIIGLGGVLISDREAWTEEEAKTARKSTTRKAAKKAPKKTTRKKTSRKKSTKKSKK